MVVFLTRHSMPRPVDSAQRTPDSRWLLEPGRPLVTSGRPGVMQVLVDRSGPDDYPTDHAHVVVQGTQVIEGSGLVESYGEAAARNLKSGVQLASRVVGRITQRHERISGLGTEGDGVRSAHAVVHEGHALTHVHSHSRADEPHHH